MNSDSITLKRTVTIKAIVTDNLKKFLSLELERSQKQMTASLERLEKEAKAMIKNLKTKDSKITKDQILGEYQNEKSRLTSGVTDLTNRIKHIKTLKNGEFFHQGTIDGFVDVMKGDNLYEKLGAMELIVEDGVIKKINETGEPWK